MAGASILFRPYKRGNVRITSQGAANATQAWPGAVPQQEDIFVIEQGQYEQLHRAVFAKGKQRVFAVLDGAIIDDLPALLERHAPGAMCLFSGDLDPMLAAAAPYLIELEPGSSATQLALRDGWNAHWGILLLVDGETDSLALRSHLRRVLRVATPDGRSMLFRFYDPRAFRTVIPTLDTDQHRQFFGPIHGCYTEGRDPGTALFFHRDNAANPRAVAF